MANGEPTERADQVTSGSGVDDTALWNPIMVGAVGLNGVCQSRGVVGDCRARDNDDKSAERIGATKRRTSRVRSRSQGKAVVGECAVWDTRRVKSMP